MKNRLSILLSFSLLLAMVSCKKEENRIYFQGGTTPALAASTAAVTLEPGLEDNTAIVLNWTNPDFKTSTGISSLDVSYTLEIDTLGANFNSGVKYTTVISNDLSKKFTVAELNGILGNTMLLQLVPRRDYTLQMRIIASIGSNVPLASNAVSFTAKPFQPPPKVAPPFTDHLYIVGDATPGAWNNPVPTPTQEFTKVSNTLFQITVQLVGGGKHFLFLPDNGKWDNKYAVHDGATQPLDGGEFGYNGGNSFYNSDIPGPAVDGTYKITVDFQLGKYTVVKQ